MQGHFMPGINMSYGNMSYGNMPYGIPIHMPRGAMPFPGAGGFSYQLLNNNNQQQQMKKWKPGKPVEKTYYDILGVPADVKAEGLKRAFRLKSITLHPDKGGTTAAYQELTLAYETLNDEEKRACYDTYGAAYEQEPRIEMFKQQIKSPDLMMPLELSLSDCLLGKEVTVDLTKYRQELYRQELSKQNRKQQDQGIMQHTFHVPAGTKNQQKFIFKGLGHKEEEKIAGALIIVVQELPHPEFKRVGTVLLYNRKISVFDALLGSRFQVKHPLGYNVTVTYEGCYKPQQWYALHKRDEQEEKSNRLDDIKVKEEEKDEKEMTKERGSSKDVPDNNKTKTNGMTRQELITHHKEALCFLQLYIEYPDRLTSDQKHHIGIAKSEKQKTVASSLVDSIVKRYDKESMDKYDKESQDKDMMEVSEESCKAMAKEVSEELLKEIVALSRVSDEEVPQDRVQQCATQ